MTLKLINSDNNYKNDILKYFEENNNFKNNNFLIDPILFFLLLQIDKEYKKLSQEIQNNINKLIQELILKIIDEVTHNKNFKLILLYYWFISNNLNYKASFFGRKIIIKYLEKELSLFEFEMIKLFQVLFDVRKNRQHYFNPSLHIKFKNTSENKNNSLIYILKNKEKIIFTSDIMTNKITNIISMINNVTDLFLFIFNEMKEENNLYQNINLNNIIELLLEKNLNNYRNYLYNAEIDDKYYTIENMSKLFKTFCIYFWLFYSLYTFIEEINNKSLTAVDLSKENVLISLLHIYYYYNKKFPDQPPILKREIINYLNFFISFNKKKYENVSISIKMKNMIGTYFDKEILFQYFKDVFSESIKNENIINTNSNFIKKEKEENEISSMFNYIKINDIQFDIYLKQFKLLFQNEENELLKCSNDYIVNLNTNMKKNPYIHKGQLIYNKYNRLLKYIKYIELESIIIDKNIFSDHIAYNESYRNYDPQIIFSIRRSIQQIYDKKDFCINSNGEINNYIEIIPKMNKNNNLNNNNTISDNNTTIINYNSIYSFSNININENQKENDDTIKNEDIKIILKENKENKNISKTMIADNKGNNIYNNKLYKSVNLNDLMNRIKKRNHFNNCEYQEEEMYCKYLSIKLLNRFFFTKKEGIKFYIFKKMKGLFYINKRNKIENQINIIIHDNEDLNDLQE